MVPRYLTLYQLPVLLRYSVRLRMDNGCIFLFLRGLLTSLSIAESSGTATRKIITPPTNHLITEFIVGSSGSHFCTAFWTKPVCLMNKSTAFWTSYLFHLIL